VPIDCGCCRATIDVTALGKTRTRPPKAAATASGAKRPRPDDDDDAPPPKAARKNAVSTAVVPPVASQAFARILVCGREYTTLKWFLNKDIGETNRKDLLSRFGSNAIESRNGDHKTLAKANFARAQRPRELLPGRVNLSSDWLDTDCKGARPPRKPVQIRRGCGIRNVFWRVEDLKQYLKS
jgi:hypothetical protein